MPPGTREPNAYQARTSEGKLKGQYYTPAALVDSIFAALDLHEDAWVFDPSCGDGSFLCGAVAALRRRFPGVAAADLAGRWAPRLVGFEIDRRAAAEARENLAAAFRTHLGAVVPSEALSVRVADPLEGAQLADLCRGAGLMLPERAPRVVVGNPPYVEAKRLDPSMKRTLARRFPQALAGAPDLYLYFLHVCLNWLREGDSLTLVLPNKLLVAANAQLQRERLLDDALLSGLWLATRAEVFGGAQVYPVVLFSRGAPDAGPDEGARVRVSPVERRDDGFRVGPAREVPLAAYRRTAASILFAPPESPVLARLLTRQLEAGARLATAMGTRWTVSFHRSGLRERFVTPERRSLFARPFVGGGAFSGNAEVARYTLQWAGWWIDYDEATLAAERNHVPEVGLFDRPKIAVAQNARTLRAAYDEGGHVLKDTFLAGVPRPGHPLSAHPRALVGLLCSRAVHFFFSHVFHGGHVSGGYLHFLAGFLDEIPLGEWSEEAAVTVAELVRARETAPPSQWEALEEEIEAHVAGCWGLTGEESAALVAWARDDANWQARDRVGIAARRRPEDASTD